MSSTDFSRIRARYEDALNEQHFSDYLQRNNVQNAGAGPIASKVNGNAFLLNNNTGNAGAGTTQRGNFNSNMNSNNNNNYTITPSMISATMGSGPRSVTPNGMNSSNQSVSSQSIATLKSNRSKMSQQRPNNSSSVQSVVSTQSKSPSIAARSTQSTTNRKTLRAHPCGTTVVNLKQYQHAVEERLTLWIDEMQERSNQRQSDYRECDMLIQHSCRLMNRYKRLTCLTIEALLELDHEIDDEEKKHVAYTDQVKDIYENQIPGIQQEMNSMRNLMALLQHFIQRAEQKKQQQEVILQQQLQQQAHTYHAI